MVNILIKGNNKNSVEEASAGPKETKIISYNTFSLDFYCLNSFDHYIFVVIGTFSLTVCKL